MSVGRTFGFAVLGIVAGAALGAGGGLLAGLAYTELASVSSFEGSSGYIVGFWMLGGVLVGTTTGMIIAIRLAKR